MLRATAGGGSAPGVGCELVVVTTRGDVDRSSSLSAVGGQGIFVKEVQEAVRDGRADAAVHSAKDLPSTTPAGLVLACVPERGDPRDALVGRTLDELAPGATVATGSPRRRAQIAWLRPDLTFRELRGNIATRVGRAEEIGTGVVAFAALERLGLADRAVSVLEPGVMLPQVAQGALAVECRADDDYTLELLGAVDDAAAHRAVEAERSWLEAIGGGCTLPVAALATVARQPGAGAAAVYDVSIELEAMISSHDGRVMLRRSATGSDPHEVGRRLARVLIEEAGGASLEWSGAS